MLKRTVLLCSVLMVAAASVLPLAAEEGLPNLSLRYERLDRSKDTWVNERWGFQGKVAVGPDDKAQQPRKPQGASLGRPEYSEKAREKKIRGIVQLLVRFDAEGKVVDAAITQSLEPGLDRNAFEYVRRWRFEPATLNGVPVPSVMVVDVNFQIA